MVIGSRSHKSEHDERLCRRSTKPMVLLHMWPRGLSKFCLIADGQAHTSTIWFDYGMGHRGGAAVLENAGGVVLRYENGERLIYNKENLLNPWFVAGCTDYVKEVV